MKTCKIVGCDRKMLALGFCMTHYYRVRRGGRGAELERPINTLEVARKRKCARPDCMGKHYAKGLCNRHYRSGYTEKIRVLEQEVIELKRRIEEMSNENV